MRGAEASVERATAASICDGRDPFSAAAPRHRVSRRGDGDDGDARCSTRIGAAGAAPTYLRNAARRCLDASAAPRRDLPRGRVGTHPAVLLRGTHPSQNHVDPSKRDPCACAVAPCPRVRNGSYFGAPCCRRNAIVFGFCVTSSRCSAYPSTVQSTNSPARS